MKKVFGKSGKKNKPRMLTEQEQIELRKDLKKTMEIARRTKVK